MSKEHGFQGTIKMALNNNDKVWQPDLNSFDVESRIVYQAAGPYLKHSTTSLRV